MFYQDENGDKLYNEELRQFNRDRNAYLDKLIQFTKDIANIIDEKKFSGATQFEEYLLHEREKIETPLDQKFIDRELDRRFYKVQTKLLSPIKQQMKKNNEIFLKYLDSLPGYTSEFYRFLLLENILWWHDIPRYAHGMHFGIKKAKRVLQVELGISDHQFSFIQQLNNKIVLMKLEQNSCYKKKDVVTDDEPEKDLFVYERGVIKFCASHGMVKDIIKQYHNSPDYFLKIYVTYHDNKYRYIPASYLRHAELEQERGAYVYYNNAYLNNDRELYYFYNPQGFEEDNVSLPMQFFHYTTDEENAKVPTNNQIYRIEKSLKLNDTEGDENDDNDGAIIVNGRIPIFLKPDESFIVTEYNPSFKFLHQDAIYREEGLFFVLMAPVKFKETPKKDKDGEILTLIRNLNKICKQIDLSDYLQTICIEPIFNHRHMNHLTLTNYILNLDLPLYLKSLKILNELKFLNKWWSSNEITISEFTNYYYDQLEDIWQSNVPENKKDKLPFPKNP